MPGGCGLGLLRQRLGRGVGRRWADPRFGLVVMVVTVRIVTERVVFR